MSLRLTNTLTRRTEPFTPLTPGKASIYCCGVTVYDLCHLGHARSYINWDVLRRYLIWRGSGGDLRSELHRHRRQDPQERQ